MLHCVCECVVCNRAPYAPYTSDQGTEPSLDLCQSLPLHETLPPLPPPALSGVNVCGFPGQAQVPRHRLCSVRNTNKGMFLLLADCRQYFSIASFSSLDAIDSNECWSQFHVSFLFGISVLHLWPNLQIQIRFTIFYSIRKGPTNSCISNKKTKSLILDYIGYVFKYLPLNRTFCILQNLHFMNI